MESLLEQENSQLLSHGNSLDHYRALKNSELRIQIFERRSADLARQRTQSTIHDWDDAYEVLADDPAWAKQYRELKNGRDLIKQQLQKN
jgi:hypothetical protein